MSGELQLIDVLSTTKASMKDFSQALIEQMSYAVRRYANECE